MTIYILFILSTSGNRAIEIKKVKNEIYYLKYLQLKFVQLRFF